MKDYDLAEIDGIYENVEDTEEKTRMRTVLQKGIHTVTWNSAAGEKTMQATLDTNYIPADKQNFRNKPKTQGEKGSQVIAVYSVDREGWRSFNVNSVISIGKANT